MVIHPSVTLTNAEQDALREAVRLLEQTVLVVHGRVVLRLSDDAELHLAGEGPHPDLNRPSAIHKRVLLLGDRAFYIEGEPGDWSLR